MSERLRHLQRQQTLLREHLAWIDGEIAREARENQTLAQPPPSTTATPSPPDTPGTIPAEADSIIEKYAAAERQNPADIRRGCLVVFFSAFALLAAGIAAVWLLFYR